MSEGKWMGFCYMGPYCHVLHGPPSPSGGEDREYLDALDRIAVEAWDEEFALAGRWDLVKGDHEEVRRRLREKGVILKAGPVSSGGGT